MSNGIKFDPQESGALRIGNANVAPRKQSISSPSSYWTSIEPINGGYTVYIDKSENGPAIYTPNNDSELIGLANKLSGETFADVNAALIWFNSYEEGNRNLIPNSRTIINNQISSSYTSNGAILSIDSVNTYQGLSTLKVDGYAGVMLNYQPKSIIEPNTIYTVSMMAKGNNTINGGLNTPLHIQIPAGDHTYETLITSDSSITTDWKQIWVTFKSNVAFNTDINIFLYAIGSVICNIAWTKLEKGSVATPWRPAMEDPDYVPDKFVLSSEIPQIVTDGLVLNLDAGIIPSYPRGGITWNDLSGNGNNGTLYNGVGYSDGSMSFDGTNDMIIIPHNEIVSLSTALTISFWFKFDQYRTDIYSVNFIGKHISGTSNFYYYFDGTYSPKIIRILCSRNGSWGRVGVSNAELNPNTWYNIVWTFDSILGSGFYINGQGSVNSQMTGVLSTNNNDIVIGNGLIGSMKDFKMYNRALSPQEVLQNYRATLKQFIPTDGLIMSLDPHNRIGGYPLIARDLSGNGNNGTLVNGVSVVKDGGGSWSFDGVDDYIDISDSQSLNLTQSGGAVSVWVKTSTDITGSINGSLISKTNSYDDGYWLTKYINKSRISIYGSTDGSKTEMIGVKIITDNLWHYIVGTWTSNKLMLYVDGELDIEQAYAFTFSTSNYPLYIGKQDNIGEGFFNGNISDVKIYNRALTSDEISTIYQSTKSKYI